MARKLTLHEARALVARAIDKAEQIRCAGAVVVADRAGNTLTASRMDDAGPLGMRTGRSKTYVAAATCRPSSDFLKEMVAVPPLLAKGYLNVLPKQPFPGAGAMPLVRDGRVIGALGASGATMGPFVKYPGCDPRMLVVDGKAANAEDLVISYARELGAYDPQHGDDDARWNAAYGELPGAEFAGCNGMAAAPKHGAQLILASALALSDAALALGRAEDVRIAVAIVDRHGDAIQLDCDDGACGATLGIAEMAAACAALFGCGSDAVMDRFGVDTLKAYRAQSGRDIAAVPGGMPLFAGDALWGAIGIGGTDPDTCRMIATRLCKTFDAGH